MPFVCKIDGSPHIYLITLGLKLTQALLCLVSRIRNLSEVWCYIFYGSKLGRIEWETDLNDPELVGADLVMLLGCHECSWSLDYQYVSLAIAGGGVRIIFNKFNLLELYLFWDPCVNMRW